MARRKYPTLEDTDDPRYRDAEEDGRKCFKEGGPPLLPCKYYEKRFLIDAWLSGYNKAMRQADMTKEQVMAREKT